MGKETFTDYSSVNMSLDTHLIKINLSFDV